MKAYVLHGKNKFSLEEAVKPVLKKGEVLVKVHSVGVSGADIRQVYTDGVDNYPLIPGHEFSGEIVEVFGGDSNDEKSGSSAKLIGKRVGVFPLIPCMECPQCKDRQYEMCKNYSYLGSRCDGGFAEYVAVPESNLIFLSDKVSYEAGAMLEPMAVAAHAVRRMKPRKGQTVAVCGLGTIGMLIVMFLKEMGINDIVVFANKQYQRDKAVELGVEPKNLGLKDRPIDVFFECVGSNETINWAISLTRPGGKVMLVGNPKSDVELPRDIYWKILRNQLTLMGTWNSSFMVDGFQEFAKPDDWKYVLDRVSDGRINPEVLITHKLRFNDLSRGFKLMRDKSEDYIKVMGVF